MPEEPRGYWATVLVYPDNENNFILQTFIKEKDADIHANLVFQKILAGRGYSRAVGVTKKVLTKAEFEEANNLLDIPF